MRADIPEKKKTAAIIRWAASDLCGVSRGAGRSPMVEWPVETLLSILVIQPDFTAGENAIRPAFRANAGNRAALPAVHTHCEGGMRHWSQRAALGGGSRHT